MHRYTVCLCFTKSSRGFINFSDILLVLSQYSITTTCIFTSISANGLCHSTLSINSALFISVLIFLRRSRHVCSCFTNHIFVLFLKFKMLQFVQYLHNTVYLIRVLFFRAMNYLQIFWTVQHISSSNMSFSPSSLLVSEAEVDEAWDSTVFRVNFKMLEEIVPPISQELIQGQEDTKTLRHNILQGRCVRLYTEKMNKHWNNSPATTALGHFHTEILHSGKKL